MYFNHGMPSVATPIWYSTSETAQQIGVTPRTVYALANKGELVGYKIGRVHRFKDDDVRSFLDSHRIQPGDLDHLTGDVGDDE